MHYAIRYQVTEEFWGESPDGMCDAAGLIQPECGFQAATLFEAESSLENIFQHDCHGDVWSVRADIYCDGKLVSEVRLGFPFEFSDQVGAWIDDTGKLYPDFQPA